jgi:hypothetical protein
MTIFLLLLFANKSKHQHGKNVYKNTVLFINCMDVHDVRAKINKKNRNFFFVMLGLCLGLDETHISPKKIIEPTPGIEPGIAEMKC